MSRHPFWHYDDQMPPGREFEIYHPTNTNALPTIYQSHEFYELYFILRGSIRVIVEEMDLTPVLGDVLIYPPGCMHRVMHTDSSTPYERFYIYLSKPFLQSISTEDFSFTAELDRLTGGGRRYFRPDEQQVRSLVPMADEIVEGAKDGSPTGIIANRCRMTLYLLRLLEVLNESITPEADGASSRMSELIRYINLHAAEQLSLDGLAEVFAMNKYALLHEFKAHTGMSVYQYILTRRIALAQQLLADGAKPRQACEESGFSDYTCFYRAFKARTGISPARYGREKKE
ncbi:MAG: helix-turn-helix transcriptional regulator [Clostridia bacterium]|nr:helix-turn-helix transcriptional regulator [Clostridia bacterium]